MTFDSYQLGVELRRLAAERPLLARFAVPVDGLKSRIANVLNGSVDPRAYQHPTFCTAHTSTYVFDPLGDIYACWERTGDERVRIGYLGVDGPVFPRAGEAPRAPSGRKLLPIAKAEPLGIDAWRSRTISTNSACAALLDIPHAPQLAPIKLFRPKQCLAVLAEADRLDVCRPELVVPPAMSA